MEHGDAPVSVLLSQVNHEVLEILLPDPVVVDVPVGDAGLGVDGDDGGPELRQRLLLVQLGVEVGARPVTVRARVLGEVNLVAVEYQTTVGFCGAELPVDLCLGSGPLLLPDRHLPLHNSYLLLPDAELQVRGSK